MWWGGVLFVYVVVALLLAAFRPRGAREAAARGNPRARRDHRCYVAAAYTALTVVPPAVVTSAYLSGWGPYAIVFWALFAGPAMLALSIALGCELRPVPAPWKNTWREQR